MHIDKVLLERIQNKDSNALEELYDRYSSYLYNLIKRTIHDTKKIMTILKQLFHEIWHNTSIFLEEKYISVALSKYCMNLI